MNKRSEAGCVSFLILGYAVKAKRERFRQRVGAVWQNFIK